MKSKGFTLIELMVVIVIMGILAAVAVPKLFGMISKAKASEVGPAAGTYVKMQKAFMQEIMYVGSWPLIGYRAPGTAQGSYKSATRDMEYRDAVTYDSRGTVQDQSKSVDGWIAKNLVPLNACEVGDNWKVSVIVDDGANFTATVLNTECVELTVSFKNIGQ